jgi:hypothetical protein
MTRRPARRRGMSALQAVLLLGAGFLVTWGLMEIWNDSKDTASTNVNLTVRGEIGKNGSGSGDSGGGGSSDSGDSTAARPAKRNKDGTVSIPDRVSGSTEPDKPGENKALDTLQTVLDVAGLIPVIGEPADLINAAISAGRGDYVGAGLSLASMIPIAGWGGTAAKAARKLHIDDLLKHTDEAADALKAANKAGDAKAIKAAEEKLAGLNAEKARRAAEEAAAKQAAAKKWTNPDGSIKWPPNRGFDGPPTPTTIPAGTRIDRYGYDGGTFVSPQGIPYPQRALAPGTEAKPYKVFEVLKPLPAQTGKIAPWFDQPGGGIQHELASSIKDLIASGHIREVILK